MQSDESLLIAENKKTSSYDGTVDKKTNRKIGGLSAKDALKVFKMAIVPVNFPETPLSESVDTDIDDNSDTNIVFYSTYYTLQLSTTLLLLCGHLSSPRRSNVFQRCIRLICQCFLV